MSWLKRIATRTDLQVNAPGLDDGGGNLAPGSQYGQTQLFTEEDGDVRKKKPTKKRKGRGRSEPCEVPKVRRSDPRGIVEKR